MVLASVTVPADCAGGAPAARAGTKRKIESICPQFFANNKDTKWTQKYHIIVFDVTAYNAGDDYYLYWKPAGSGSDPELIPIVSETQGPRVFTTQTILGLVCGADKSTTFTITSVDTQMPSTTDTNSLMNAVLTTSFVDAAKPGATRDFLYTIKPVQTNMLSEIDVTGPPPQKAPKTPKTRKTLALADGNATVIAWFLIERHQVIHYGLGGGFVGTRASPVTYGNVSTPTAITTTTNTSKSTTVVTNPPTSGGSNGSTCAGTSNSTCSQTTSTQTSTQVQNTTGTQNYLLGTKSSQWQINALAGLTIYPFGRDTYLNGDHFRYIRFDRNSLKNEIGVFIGTSVNTFGNFTVAPSLELFPGTQLVAGVTWWNKTVPTPGVTACSGYGKSPSYQVVPPSTTTDTVVQTIYTSPTSSTVASTTTTQTNTTVTTTATSGCANGDVATLLSGTNVPTQTEYVPAFSIGITFNTNLAKGFQGFFK